MSVIMNKISNDEMEFYLMLCGWHKELKEKSEPYQFWIDPVDAGYWLLEEAIKAQKNVDNNLAESLFDSMKKFGL